MQIRRIRLHLRPSALILSTISTVRARRRARISEGPPAPAEGGMAAPSNSPVALRPLRRALCSVSPTPALPTSDLMKESAARLAELVATAELEHCFTEAAQLSDLAWL